MLLIKQTKGKKKTETADHVFHACVYEMPIRLFVSCFLGCFQNFYNSFIVISFSIEFLCIDTGSLFSTLLFCQGCQDVRHPGRWTSFRRWKRPMTSGLRELYLGVKARASSRWERFRVSVLQMAVPTGRSVPTHPPRRPLAVRPAVGIADRPADDCFSRAAVRQPDCMLDGGGHPYGRLLRASPRQSAGPTARWTASSVPWPSAQSSARLSTARTASCLIPAPDSPPPLPPTVLSTVEFQVSIRRAAQTPSVCFRTYVSQELSTTLYIYCLVNLYFKSLR